VASWAAWRGIKAASDEASRRCGALSIGEKRQACLFKVRMDLLNKKTALIRKGSSNCDGNPKCLKSAKKALDKITKRKSQLIKSYRKKIQKS
jgi:hypothetical protein